MNPKVVHIWLGVAFILNMGAWLLRSQMLKYRIPREGLLHPFWWRGFTIITDPANYTEAGQFYRRWTIRFEVAAMIWMFSIVFVFAALSRE